jgi:hypothetical protein
LGFHATNNAMMSKATGSKMFLALKFPLGETCMLSFMMPVLCCNCSTRAADQKWFESAHCHESKYISHSIRRYWKARSINHLCFLNRLPCQGLPAMMNPVVIGASNPNAYPGRDSETDSTVIDARTAD